MRKRVWVLGGMVALVLGARGGAQQQGAGSFIGSFNGVRVVNKPIDMSKVAAPIQVPRRPFSLTDIFPTFSLPTTRNVLIGNRVPSPSEFPGVKFQSPLQPLPPIIPNR